MSDYKGEARFVNPDIESILSANHSTFISAGHKYRLQNLTDDDLVMIEVQCGEYLGKHDIECYEDTYGRR